MLNSYTYQHTIGQATESETPNSDGEPQDTYNLRAERGNVTPDFRHPFTSAWSYELPFGPGRRYLQDSGLLGLLAGGWQLNGIISLYSGQAFTPYLSFDPTNTGSGGPRPDRIGNPYDFSNSALGFDGGNNGGPRQQAARLRLTRTSTAGTIQPLSFPAIALGQPAPPAGTPYATCRERNSRQPSQPSLLQSGLLHLQGLQNKREGTARTAR